MKNFFKNFIAIIAVSAIFSTICFVSNTNESIVVNAKSKHKKAKHHKSKKRAIKHKRSKSKKRAAKHKRYKYHMSYQQQMSTDVNNYNEAMSNDNQYSSYELGNDGDNKYTNDYDGIIGSLGKLVSDNNGLSLDNDNYYSTVSENRNDAVSIYNVFNKRFSKQENSKLNDMRHQISGNITDDNYYNTKNNVSMFLQELQNAISSLKK